MMHYVSYVNLRRDFVEEMCFKKIDLMNIDTYRQRQRGRKRERELWVQAEIKIDSIRLLTR